MLERFAPAFRHVASLDKVPDPSFARNIFFKLPQYDSILLQDICHYQMQLEDTYRPTPFCSLIDPLSQEFFNIHRDFLLAT